MFGNAHKTIEACESLEFPANPERGTIGCRRGISTRILSLCAPTHRPSRFEAWIIHAAGRSPPTGVFSAFEFKAFEFK